MSEVYLNGKFVGTVENPSEFTEKVRIDRRKGQKKNTKNLKIYLI